MAINRDARINDDVLIDPNFAIPDGITEWSYDPNALDRVGDNDVSDDLIDEDEEDSPPTPTVNGIISQTVHRQKNGSSLVDVVFDVTPVPGAKKYEFRVTKR